HEGHVHGGRRGHLYAGGHADGELPGQPDGRRGGVSRDGWGGPPERGRDPVGAGGGHAGADAGDQRRRGWHGQHRRRRHHVHLPVQRGGEGLRCQRRDGGYRHDGHVHGGRRGHLYAGGHADGELPGQPDGRRGGVSRDGWGGQRERGSAPVGAGGGHAGADAGDQRRRGWHGQHRRRRHHVHLPVQRG